ncbi:MAG: phosphate ABC transporter permease subunit PstC [Chloroflexota bacterium]|nr:MAG: phosphate ABC transporter permease subunit PstC [Chloroflexota bacterium]
MVSDHAFSRNADSVFANATLVVAFGSLATIVALALTLAYEAWPAIARYGIGFLASSNWDPVFEEFGALHFAYGTVVTSLLALLIATPIAVGAALFVAEYAPRWLGDPISFIVELLAVIPSIIYGLWGFFVLGPLMKGAVEPALKAVLGDMPILGALVEGPPFGRDYLTAATILAIMITPTVMAVSREIFRAVPDTQREGMVALGATRWETIRHAVLPYARSGIAGAAGLGLARALGETMAVTMVIGNSSSDIRASFLTPGYTLASAIANQFTEADKDIYFSAIVELALVLLLVATAVNLLARLLVFRFTRHGEAGR